MTEEDLLREVPCTITLGEVCAVARMLDGIKKVAQENRPGFEMDDRLESVLAKFLEIVCEA